MNNNHVAVSTAGVNAPSVLPLLSKGEISETWNASWHPPKILLRSYFTSRNFLVIPYLCKSTMRGFEAAQIWNCTVHQNFTQLQPSTSAPGIDPTPGPPCSESWCGDGLWLVVASLASWHSQNTHRFPSGSERFVEICLFFPLKGPLPKTNQGQQRFNRVGAFS
jgi:hypothetical protein